jgi:tRNA-specific 2-thiouridylase
MTSNVKAIGLLSGGLDSTLALRIIRDLNIEVLAINFHTGFCLTDVRRASSKTRSQGGASDALSTAASLGVKIEIVDASVGYLDIIHHPKHGYGKNVNPCIDCRIHMFKLARQKMEETGSQFVFTGEVLGQRPMSQHLEALKLIANESGLSDRILRPLSARLLTPTLPEREGWIDRSKLFDFNGRTRKPQVDLARKLGIGSYPQPAGGCCFLTDPQYGHKVHDLWDHKSKDSITWNDYLLLKVGRHIRLNPNTKIIVGRDEGENLFLEQMCGSQTRIEVRDYTGPIALIDSSANEEEVSIAARIVARYADCRELDETVTVDIMTGAEVRLRSVKPFKPEEIASWVIS